MIHLAPQYLNIVFEILKKSNLEEKVFVFGSRARGDHSRYSDLDLVFQDESPLAASVLVRLIDDFEKSSLPITVDLIDWSQLSDDFKAKIKNEMVRLQV